MLYSKHSWEEVKVFNALGHLVSCDGSAIACFGRTARLPWKSFFANAGHKRFSRAPLQQKLTLIDRATKPVWKYRCPRWPPSKGMLKMACRLQNRMIAVTQRPRPSDGETAASFISRRNRAAAVVARSRATWAEEHVRLCTTWMEHLLRPANSSSFASMLLHYKDAEWLHHVGRHLDLIVYPEVVAHDRLMGSSCLAGRKHS